MLVHGDLSPSNIIVGANGNVTGIIDLGSAQMVPLQFAATYPNFLVHPTTWLESYADPHSASCPVQSLDRAYYQDCIRGMADELGGIAREYSCLLSRPDENERYWWFRESTQINIHVSKASGKWTQPGRRCQ